MPTPSIHDLTSVEVEHLLGAATGLPLVKVRALAETSAGDVVVSVGALEVSQARSIAEHLLTAAARAEYEADLVAGLTAADLGDSEILATVLGAVRSGEVARETGQTDG